MAGVTLEQNFGVKCSVDDKMCRETGYATNKFEGKIEQMVQVSEYIKAKGLIPPELVQNEVAWFYNNLGIDDMYFSMESVEVISGHIIALYGSKILSFTKNEINLDIHLERETEEGAVYIHTSKPGVSQLNGPQIEKKIDSKYLENNSEGISYRLETYRSLGTVSSSLKTQLRCYFVKKCVFQEDTTKLSGKDSSTVDMKLISDKVFLEKASANTLEIYQMIIKKVLDRSGPVIEVFDIENNPNQKRLVIGYKKGSCTSFFSSMSDLYHYYNLSTARKYVEHFANGITIMSFYLFPVSDHHETLPIEISVQQVVREASLMYCLPITPLQSFFKSGQLSIQETMYGYAGLVFAQHFLNRLGNEYNGLNSVLDSKNPLHVEILAKIKKRLRQDTFTREYVLDIVKLYPDLIKALYVNFATTHYIQGNNRTLSNVQTLSFQRISADISLSDEELHEKIRKTVSNPHQQMVFEAFLNFNRHVLKTNFYQPTKVALSFRLNPGFLPEEEYPIKPFGMFMVLGNAFRGFHIRFRDIARGGIRIIKSRNREAYSINLRTLFDENYALALTQQKKNKDIPEGGSKGTILLDYDSISEPKSRIAFEKYVDSILDLLIEGKSPGIKERIVDKYGRPEILFFGPDEGTAEYVDWASAHARKRGASFWKAFTTGKSPSFGGIPHDHFGMTTRSVHQYVIGLYRKFGLIEDQITKFQTGGPDGDLGSNEIKISKDKTIGIVDGSGVVYDPEGLDRNEISYLASQRKMISNFNVKKLSTNGFRVLIDEKDVKLPDGSIIEDGLRFRNEFHLDSRVSADLFVPCGGRPEAVDISNVSKLLKPDGTPRFKYIVEGANLFFTQEARLRLESAGCIIFKDASANKGGVTSSSLEVLAALSLADDEFINNMCCKESSPPPEFYTNYIKDVHEIIEKNAELEFECIWREAKRSGLPNSVLSDEISAAIVKLNEELQQTSFWDNKALRNLILSEAIPSFLLSKLGLSVIVARVPESYMKAMFGSYLASRFVYQYGIAPSQFAFFEFMSRYFEKLSQSSANKSH